ncbi:phosphate ABC transporter permease PstA [Luteolibacter pohnpeiensis]|uniref:Phosphate transport system permease protein PstA n=1 Tax=Luteolibacter pohnpeiensis TaxID=454153 RepID=A0A934SA82_9BACT|nr:phosphate ABC transporter permease PstA [Luteolibacter pohnpeiensis]MBK1883726.1 phosphate ABC transporter permease PstA [Luteolibacter pohnpeiensis]
MSAEEPKNQTPFSTTGRSRKGEPWVWLTAMGLSIGVVMALGLLLLIVVKGTASFWPRRIELMEVKTPQGKEMIAGFITRETERKDSSGALHQEVQIFRGNKDISGDTFRFYDRKDILKASRPKDYLRIERTEYGPAIVKPVALETSSGKVPAKAADFHKKLDEWIDQAADARAQLLVIERKKIGAISREIDALDTALKNQKVDPKVAEKRRAELQAEFDQRQKEAAEIRAKFTGTNLLVQTADGHDASIPVANVMGVFQSNQAGLFQRMGEMWHRIWEFLSDEPREANTEGGVFPAIFGTVVMTLVMSLFVTPFGVIAAIYLREYAKQGMVVRIVRICVNNLAGVPSIVFGVFGLAFFVYFVGAKIDHAFFADQLPTPTYGTPGILWASLTLALLTLPVVIVATEEALSAVPRGVREAALACGASKWQTIQRVVLPASLPGILTGVILAMARGAGEVAPLMLVGVVKFSPTLPIDGVAPFIHPDRKFMHLGFHIFDLGFQSPDAEAAIPVVYATALLLIVVVVTLNLTAILIRNRLKKRFATSSF